MATLIDSYSESNYNQDLYLGSGGNPVVEAQDFTTPAAKYKITSAKFYIHKSGSPTGSCYAKLYTSSGTLLATSDAVDVSGLGAGYALQTFTFSGASQYLMDASTGYWIGCAYGAGTYVYVGAHSPSGRAGSRHYSTNGSSFATDAGLDIPFYVYGDLPPVPAGGSFLNLMV